MDKQEIINYVMHTPNNTNPNVLESMLNSMDGVINMVTIFDDNINYTHYTEGSSYGPPCAYGYGVFKKFINEDGIIRVTYENKSALGLYTSPTGDGLNIRFSAVVHIKESSIDNISITDYNSLGSFYFNIMGLADAETEFKAYCKEPHHLKIEWFTI